MKLEIEKYKVTIYGEEGAKTLVLVHENHDEGSEIWELLSGKTKSGIMLACISGIAWNHDMTPWEAPAFFKKADPFTGGADEYMKKLEGTMLPEIQNKTNQTYECIYIAGYSLAGLFATYAGIETDIFDGFVSASGSMWYPNFLSYVKKHPLPKKTQKAYFSIGDKEAKTKNQFMQTVEENTREIERLMSTQGVTTKFELNPGGHFTDDSKRLVKGIEWVISGGEKNNPIKV